MNNVISKKISPVGILLSPGIDYVVAMFAALKCGVGFVPLDVHYPIERLNYIIKVCKITKVISCDAYQHIYKQLPVKVVFTNGKSVKESIASRKCDPTSVAYLVFTSGTTGNPKGIPITHENLLPLMLWQKKHFSLSTATRMAQTLSLTFDFGIQEVLTTVLFGGNLIIPDAKQRLSSEEYLKFLNSCKINVLYTTPTHLASLLSFGCLEHVKYLLVGGEKFDGKLFKTLTQKTLPDCKIINGYGPSEVTINVAMQFASHDTTLNARDSLAIGKPSANNKVYILDRDGWPVPNKVPGEIFLGGVGVTHGYINNPEQTAQVFLQHPFLKLGRLYRTGDYGHFNDDVIIFRNRQDSQRKINGYRVELTEIVIQFESISGIKKVYVMLIEEKAMTKIVAFYTSSSSQPVNQEILRKQLTQKLPAYMLPSYFIWLANFPINKNNKIAEEKLRALYLQHIIEEQPLLEQTSALVDQIIAIWRRVLNVPIAHAYVDLFSLGITSLTLSQLHYVMEQELKKNIPLSSLFHFSTPAAIAQMLTEELPNEQSEHPVLESSSKQQHLTNLRKRYQTLYETETSNE